MPPARPFTHTGGALDQSTLELGENKDGAYYRGHRFYNKDKTVTTDWLCKHHNDLGKEQLYAILELRSKVFVVEQKCAYQDVDGQDLTGDTLHVMGWQDDQLVAYARLLDPESQGGDVVIGRVIVAPEGRGQKLGHTLMSKALESIEEYWPEMPIFMSAQTYLTPFYERYEFVTVGDPYMEDGIEHIGMRRAETTQG